MKTVNTAQKRLGTINHLCRNIHNMSPLLLEVSLSKQKTLAQCCLRRVKRVKLLGARPSGGITTPDL